MHWFRQKPIYSARNKWNRIVTEKVYWTFSKAFEIDVFNIFYCWSLCNGFYSIFIFSNSRLTFNYAFGLLEKCVDQIDLSVLGSYFEIVLEKWLCKYVTIERLFFGKIFFKFFIEIFPKKINFWFILSIFEKLYQLYFLLKF